MEKNNDFIGKILHFIFAKENLYLMLFILILLLSIILRFLAVNNAAPVGDEMVHGTHAINILGYKPLSTLVESPVWFYITDIGHEIFGITSFGSRVTSFFYGIGIIFLTFIIGSRVFNKKSALIASFLVAVSGFAMRYSAIAMDMSMMFFAMLSTYFLIDCMQKRQKISLLSALFLGIAVLNKMIAVFFGPAFAVYVIYMWKKSENKKSFVKNNTKQFIYWILIFLIIIFPIFAHNYLLYQEKGLVTEVMAQYFGINKTYYLGPLGHDQGASLQFLLPSLKSNLGAFWTMDPLLLIFFALGLIITFKAKDEILLLGSMILFYSFFMSISSGLGTHYTEWIPLFALFAAQGIIFTVNEVQKHVSSKQILTIILLIIALSTIYASWGFLSSRSAVWSLRDYAIDNIGPEDLVIVDSRIYEGRIAWMFNDKHYIGSQYAGQLLNSLDEFTGQTSSVRVHIIECDADDCGWGTVGSGPLNDSSENFFNQIKEAVPAIAKINGGGDGYNEVINQPYFTVYEANLPFKRSMFQLVDSTHKFFYYPVRFEPKEEVYDYIGPQKGLNNLISKFGYLSLWTSIMVALFSLLLVVHMTYKELTKQ